MKLVLDCVQIFSVRFIQTGNTYLLPTQLCGSLWQGCQLGVHFVHTNWLIFLISYLFQGFCTILILLIFDFYLLCLLDRRSLILKISPGCVRKLSVDRIQIGFTDLLSLWVRGKTRRWCRLHDCNCHHQWIDWIKVNHPKFFL